MPATRTAAPKTPARSRRRLALLLGAGGLFLLAITLLIPATLGFTRHVLAGATHTVVSFQAGETRVFTPEPGVGEYVVWARTNTSNDAVPSLRFEVNAVDGEGVSASSSEGWRRLFGQSDRRLLRFAPGGAGPIEIKAEFEDPADSGSPSPMLIVTEEPGGMLARAADAARPWWIGGGASLACMVVCLLGALSLDPRTRPENAEV